MDMYTFMKPLTRLNLDLLSSATTMPRGSEPKSVSAKIRNVFHMPEAIVESIVENVIIRPQFPFSLDNSSAAGRFPQHLLYVVCILQPDKILCFVRLTLLLDH